MTSKSVGGWDSVLGLLYNDGWVNEASPEHSSPTICQVCNSSATIHKLKKTIPMFGHTVTKHCTVTTCPDCLNEQVMVAKSTVKVRKGIM